MTDYVFIGRRRPLVPILVYGVLTFGVYGRILAYRHVKEIDGHRALFIDLRLIRFLLFLPILGPLAVKLQVRRILQGTVERDVTHPRVRSMVLAWLALIPIVPAFHMVVQNHLNVYWRRQQKIEDIKHRRSDIDRLSTGRATDEKKAAIKDLEAQILRREQALKDEEDAARAILEAEQERRRAEEELRRLHKGPVARITAKAKGVVPSRSGGKAAPGQEAGGAAGGENVGRVSRLRTGFRKPPAPEDATSQDLEPAKADDEPAAGVEKTGLASRLRGLLARSPNDEEGEPAAKPARPSRAERRSAKKEARKAAKEVEAEEEAAPDAEASGPSSGKKDA